MNYEQKYKETIERMKSYCEGHHTDVNPKAVMEFVFPELRESEDERIRKEIISFIIDRKNWFPKEETKTSWIAWLEKQGEQKPADKEGAKFKIEKGKWYVCIKDLLDNYANKAFCEGDIYLSTQDGSLIPSNSNVPFEVTCPDTHFRDWTIQDANDGDILTNDNIICIFKRIKPHYDYLFESHCEFINKKNFGLGFDFNINGFHIATKEQRKFLFQKMKEEGYEWDAEKKELRKIEQKSVEWNYPYGENETVDKLIAIAECLEMDGDCEFNGYTGTECGKFLRDLARKQVECKPAGNEDDERMIETIIYDLERHGGKEDSSYSAEINWLKSLKDRFQLQPKQEWSEEDESNLNGILDCYKSMDIKWRNWLKSLKSSHWKPSEEQMKGM